MGIRLDGNTVRIEGRANVEDAEPLFVWLQEDRSRVVDIAGAEHVHSAVIQVLFALRPAVNGSSRDPFIRDWVIPILQVDAAASTLVERA